MKQYVFKEHETWNPSICAYEQDKHLSIYKGNVVDSLVLTYEDGILNISITAINTSL